jgi:DNA-directed RNA polymerase subunit RPC12/RpoP
MWYFTAYSDTKPSAITALTRVAQDHAMRRGFRTLLQALPFEAREAKEREARLLLEVNHTVVLASKGTSVEEIADDIKRREYSERIRAEVKEIEDAVKDGDITDQDGVYTRIHEIEVIYISKALDVLRYSKNDEAYWEQMGGETPGWESLATCALQEDVTQALSFDPENIHEVDCPRCGTVVSTEDESDETDCPKCALDLSTEERNGFEIRAESADQNAHVCLDCLKDEVRELDTTHPLPAKAVFECGECGETFITPEEDNESDTKKETT